MWLGARTFNMYVYLNVCILNSIDVHSCADADTKYVLHLGTGVMSVCTMANAYTCLISFNGQTLCLMFVSHACAYIHTYVDTYIF
jgi:hypothetical protein